MVRATSLPVRMLVLACVPACACAPAGRMVAVAAPLEIVEFVIYRGEAVAATEHVERYADRLLGTVSVTDQARVRYAAQLDEHGDITRIDAEIRPWPDTATRVQQVRVDIGSDSVIVYRPEWMGVPQRYAATRAVPYLHPSPALLEKLIRRGLAAGTTPIEQHVWLVSSNTRVNAQVSFPSEGEAHVQMAGARVRVMLEAGRIAVADVPQLEWIIERRRPPQ